MPIFNSVIELIIFWMVCGVICYFIMKSKSYNNNECLLGGVAGAVLSIVGIIICLCMKEKNSNKAIEKKEPKNDEDNLEKVCKWFCIIIIAVWVILMIINKLGN